MRITREEALKILKYQKENPNGFFPFVMVNQEYTPADNDFVEICPKDNFENILEDENYQTFELWDKNENQNSDELEREFLRFIEQYHSEKTIDKIAVFDYSCGKIFGVNLPKKCNTEEVEELLFGEKYGFKESQIEWMEVEGFVFKIL